jgi:hypothetical protein
MSEYKSVTFDVLFVRTVTCGEDTCASAPGVFCNHIGSRRFGSQPHCMMHHVDLYEVTNGERKGWVERCLACKEKEELSKKY